MSGLASRSFEMILRNEVHFGIGSIERLPEWLAAAGGSRTFVVTDPGVRASGVIERVSGILASAGIESEVFDGVAPNPGTATVERGAAARFHITPVQAATFVARARALVSAGRPICPMCSQPKDPAGHACPRSNGHVVH